ncbi:MAG: SDR family NAD(P)-dependent oxidoreductase [Rhodococcus sp. (in: high G+C Gram-positive bacteria)]|uniref:SDR family NAD(P)-dependent oxidoreductase n=1 Tax=Rhodococcus sp. TaxID=1831 RepID=UPI003BB73B6E
MTSRWSQIRRWRRGAALHLRMRDLTGTLVVVTGGGSGIGRAAARAFSAAGAIVVVADIDMTAAQETVELIDTPDPHAGGAAAVFGGGAHAYHVDVTDEEQVRQLAQTVRERHGTVDILVNNAGLGVIGSFVDTPQDAFERVIDVNFWGVVYGCRAFAEQMIERGTGGHIVNVSSAAAFMPQKRIAAYATSKAAVLMLSDCLRAELLEDGIGVTAVCPSLVATNFDRSTEFVEADPQTEKARRSRTSAVYRKLAVPPERVANAMVAAVRHNQPIVTVAPDARARKWISRLAPRVMRVGSRFEI